MTEDDYWLGVAKAVAAGAKCTRRQVGALLVKNGRIFSAGKNGTPPGELNCTEGGCPRGKLSYAEKAPNSDYSGSACIHAELNALLYASREQTEGATVYCTDAPCDDCFRHIRAAGVAKIVTPDFEWKRL